MAEKRVDPTDGKAYTFEEIESFYSGTYKRNDIVKYWKGMAPVKGGGKGYATAVSQASLPVGVEFMDIDGSFGEGGGQVLRNTFAYAAVLGRPIRVTKIRNGRPKPGLANQHLTGITAVSDLSGGSLSGAEVRSTEVLFVPAAHRRDELDSLVADCGTAGALTLVIQSILPVLVLGSGSTPTVQTVVTCKGGTDVPFSPPMDYLREVTLQNLSHFGVNATVEIVARGIMPAGRGIVNVSCSPATQLTPLRLLDCGRVESVSVSTLFCGEKVPEDVAQQVSASATALMRASCKDTTVDENVMPMSPAVPSNFLSVSVTARTSTGCVLNGNALHSAKSISPKALAEEACGPLIANIARGSCLDEHCADQVVIFMAMAAGESAFRTGPLTEHTRTAIHFAHVCTGADFHVEPVADAATDLFEVRCAGIGWRGEHAEK